MKLFILFLFILTTTSSIANYDFDIQQTMYQFADIVKTDSKIIMTTSTNTLLVSEDKGKTWNNIQLSKELWALSHIQEYDESYIGLCQAHGIFKADKNFENHQIMVMDTLAYWDMTIVDDKIFVSASHLEGKKRFNFILVYDENFDLIISYYNEDQINPGRLAYFNNRLITNDGTKLIVYDNENEFQKQEYDISSFASSIKSMRVIDDTLYACLMDTVYQDTSKPGHSYKYTDKDRGSIYKCNSIEQGWEKIGGFADAYTIFNDSIYMVNCQHDYRDDSYFLEFKKYVGNGQFEVISKACPKFSYNFYLTNLEIIDDDNILVYGAFNTLLHSDNAGQSWSLISAVNNLTLMSTRQQDYWASDSLGIFNFGNYLYKTEDAGLTWGPMFSKPDVFFSRFQTFELFGVSEDGREYALSTDYNLNFEELYPEPYYNFVYSKDNGKTHTCKWIDEIYSLDYETHYLSSILTDNGLLIAYAIPNYNRSNILRLNNDFDVIDTVVVNNVKILNMKKGSSGNILAYGTAPKSGGIETVIISSIDNGETWNEEFRHFIDNGKSAYISLWNEENLFIRIQLPNDVQDLYIIDTDKMEISEISSDQFNVDGAYFTAWGYLYAYDSQYRLIRSKDYKSDNSSWELADLGLDPKWNISVNRGWANDNAVCLMVRDGIYSNFFIITQSDTISVIEQTEGLKYFYALPMHPNPARSYARTTIWWDLGRDLSQTSARVYNSSGADVTQSGSVRITPEGGYKAGLDFNCQGLPPGVYFIHLKNGSNSRAVPVVVGR